MSKYNTDGGEWELSDSGKIIDNPDKGFDEVKYKYGIILETKKQVKEANEEAERQSFEDFINKINEYLKPEQYPGRTELQSLFEENIHYLYRKAIGTQTLQDIQDCLYKMANGEIDWDTFVSDTKEKMELVNDVVRFTRNKNVLKKHKEKL